ncbi:MAG: hypothetical protein MK134_05055 [Dehalococcoidia bacterium]|nr:hypothetical protein [Dehalococcoidia bacterium]
MKSSVGVQESVVKPTFEKGTEMRGRNMVHNTGIKRYLSKSRLDAY